MSDNLRRYRAIHEALTQCYEAAPSGRLAQHLTTLAAFVSGIVGSRSSQLPKIATQIPGQAKAESRVKRLSRWLNNEGILESVYFLPHAELLLHCLALETLVLVMDGSGVGRGLLGLNDPCALQRESSATGLAGTAVPEGPFSRGIPYRLGGAGR